MTMHIKITDPDDPRIKNGATCQWEKTTTVTSGKFVIEEPYIRAGAIRNAIHDGVTRNGGVGEDLYLIEEAPDPMIAKRMAIAKVLRNDGQNEIYSEVLASKILRALNELGEI